MITGIYNLPKEFCSAMGDAITEFIYSGNTEADYQRNVKNAFSILSEDSKIMIGELDFSLFGEKLTLTSTWMKVSNEDRTSTSILSMLFITIMRVIVFVTVIANEESPDILAIQFWRFN